MTMDGMCRLQWIRIPLLLLLLMKIVMDLLLLLMMILMDLLIRHVRLMLALLKTCLSYR